MKVLMIFNDFAPLNNCASIPNTKLVKYLEKEAVDLTLITSAIEPEMDIDESLLPENIKSLRRFYVQNSKLYKSTVGAQRTKITNNGVKLKMKSETRKFRAHAVLALKYLYYELTRFDWIKSAKKILKTDLKGETFDVVYSSYPAYAAHLLAKYLVKKGIAKKWMADFRDPMYYPEFDSYKVSQKRERQHEIEKMADVVTIVSKGAKKKFLFEDVPSEKIIYIPNGYDPDDLVVNVGQKQSASTKLRIFYAGTLYAGKRDLSVIFKALSDLVNEGKVIKDNISLEYAGNEWPIYYGFANNYGFTDCIINYGYVTRSKVMEIMSEIDCTVVCTHNTAVDQGVVTGKIFELLLVEKPIITIVRGDIPNSELAEIVRKCNAGAVYEEVNDQRDYERLKQWLYEKYCEKMEKGFTSQNLNTNERDKYSYQSIAHDVYQVLSKLAE